jgi:hypothetical protein
MARLESRPRQPNRARQEADEIGGINIRHLGMRFCRPCAHGIPCAMTFLLAAAVTSAALLAGAGFFHLLPRLGPPGRRLANAFTRAPLLDLPITYFTVAPIIVGPIVAGWAGLAGGIVGQVAALIIWTLLHEAAHPQARKGPRILRVINSRVGTLRNYAAVYLTATVVPVFWIVRVAQVLVYPGLTLLVRLPPYRHGDWVSISRHKFQGLVGHDRVWCLYCDWMTGVWSLGSEMLRNVESFWCPIRFSSEAKCANCRVDFPDIDGGWVPAHATIAEVAQTLERHYRPGDKYHPWFGHPARLTIERKPLPEPAGAQS